MNNNSKCIWGWKRELTLLLCLFSFVWASAGDDHGYYWYHNHVFSHPIGRGLVYASDSKDEPTEDMYAEELTVKFCSTSSNEELSVFNLPKEGYHFNGWYEWIDGELGNFITKENVIGGLFNHGFLYNEHSEDNDTAYYSVEPNNEFAGVFGRVNYEVEVDNLQEWMSEEEEDNTWNFSLAIVIDDLLYESLSISNPCNDIGDEIILHTDPLCEYVSGNDDEDDYDDVENNETEIILRFKEWIDSQGRKYSEPTLKVTVDGPETYTAHYELTMDGETAIASIKQAERNVPQIYNIKGQKVSPQSQSPGLFIINGRKVVRK